MKVRLSDGRVYRLKVERILKLSLVEAKSGLMGTHGSFAEARCNPVDAWDQMTGERIAMERLVATLNNLDGTTREERAAIWAAWCKRWRLKSPKPSAERKLERIVRQRKRLVRELEALQDATDRLGGREDIEAGSAPPTVHPSLASCSCGTPANPKFIHTWRGCYASKAAVEELWGASCLPDPTAPESPEPPAESLAGKPENLP